MILFQSVFVVSVCGAHLGGEGIWSSTLFPQWTGQGGHCNVISTVCWEDRLGPARGHARPPKPPDLGIWWSPPPYVLLLAKQSQHWLKKDGIHPLSIMFHMPGAVGCFIVSSTGAAFCGLTNKLNFPKAEGKKGSFCAAITYTTMDMLFIRHSVCQQITFPISRQCQNNICKHMEKSTRAVRHPRTLSGESRIPDLIAGTWFKLCCCKNVSADNVAYLWLLVFLC